MIGTEGSAIGIDHVWLSSTAPTPTETFKVSNNSFDVTTFSRTIIADTMRTNRDIEAAEIRRDRTISRKERRKKLSILRKKKQ